MPAIAPKIQFSGTRGHDGSTRQTEAFRAEADPAAGTCDSLGAAHSTTTEQTDNVRHMMPPDSSRRFGDILLTAPATVNARVKRPRTGIEAT
jgi:hypothetical protein